MKIVAMIFSAAVILTTGVPLAQAQRLNYPYCAIFDSRTLSCAFNTMAQCYATISGRGGWCEVNAWYQPPAKARARRKSS